MQQHWKSIILKLLSIKSTIITAWKHVLLPETGICCSFKAIFLSLACLKSEYKSFMDINDSLHEASLCWFLQKTCFSGYWIKLFPTGWCGNEKTLKRYQQLHIWHWSLNKGETSRSAWTSARSDKPYSACTCCRTSFRIFVWRWKMTKRKTVYCFTFFCTHWREKIWVKPGRICSPYRMFHSD